MPDRSSTAAPSLALDPVAAAIEAGLRYVDNDEPGIRRRRCGRGFTYLDPAGNTVRDPEVRRRVSGLAIPPAWTGVWICVDPNGHIQATGRDGQERKQYRYHPRWHEVRNAAKYGRLLPFGRVLPCIRAGLDRHLALRGLPREKILATIVRLLESTCIRIGNETYRRRNGTHGLTTLRTRHVEISGSRLRFEFKAKSGLEREVSIVDRRVARILRRCQELPGHVLFQYLDDDGARSTVDSGDVNEYLRSLAGERYTAKDFRTWMGSVHAVDFLVDAGPAATASEAERQVLAAIDHVASELSNTRAVCREFYVHPGVVESYRNGRMFEILPRSHPPAARGLDGEEIALLTLLEDLEGHGRPRLLAA